MAESKFLDVRMALVYFHAYMFGPLRGKARLYRERDLRVPVAMPEDWEVFASILVRNAGASSASGPDLQDYEVKSALAGSAFEYQYHKDSWQEKLVADRRAGHIFISHKDELAYVEVRHCAGADLAGFFDKWRGEKPYSDPRAQRFRRSVSYGWVKQKATLILRIEDGEATCQRDLPLPR